MSRDLTGTWIVTSLSAPDGVDLMYAAIALSDSFRQSMKRFIAAGKAAAEVYGSEGITLKTWCSDVYWLGRAPENHDYFEDLDAGDWVEMKLPPMAELVLSENAAQKLLDEAVDSVSARTECEEVVLRHYLKEPDLCFSAYEKHGETKASTSGLPPYVIEWIQE